MIERLRICWYALTKRHFAFWAYDYAVLDSEKRGCVCVIDDEACKCKPFLEAVSENAIDILNEDKEQPKEPFELGEKVVCKKENVIATLEDAGFFQGKVVYGIRYDNGDKIYRYAEDIKKYENSKK